MGLMSSTENTIKTNADKVSYGIGLQMAQQVKGQTFPDFNLDALIIGIKDVFANHGLSEKIRNYGLNLT